MAQFGEEITRTSDAVADLRTNQYDLLRATAANGVNVASNAGLGAANIVGVLKNKPNSGQSATIVWMGETKVRAGEALTVHEPFTTNNSGRAASIASGNMIVGLALEAAGADGEFIRALVSPAYQAPNSFGA